MKYILICSVIFFSLSAPAQERFYVSAIAGTYNMGNLKAFQEELRKDLSNSNIPVKIVMEFPASLQAELGIEFRQDDRTLSGFLSYAVAQGKLHYADYSGETYAAQQLTRIAPGFKAMQGLGHNIHLYGKVALSATFMDLVFETKLSGDAGEKEILKFKAVGAAVEPGIQWEYTVRRFSLLIHAGYELNFNGKTNFVEEEDAHLINDDGEPIVINWSGARVGAGISINFGK